jgi:hypothetical protein
MPDIIISIPPAYTQRVLDAFAALHGWDASGAETKAAFAKRVLVTHIKQTVANYEAQSAGRTAIENARRAAIDDGAGMS